MGGHSNLFKHLGFVLDESATDGVECFRKMASGRRNVTDANLMRLRLYCARACVSLF